MEIPMKAGLNGRPHPTDTAFFVRKEWLGEGAFLYTEGGVARSPERRLLGAMTVTANVTHCTEEADAVSVYLLDFTANLHL